MEDCQHLVRDIVKQLPTRIDASTIRTGAKCEKGVTKPSQLVFYDSIESKTDPEEWKSALKSSDGQAKLIKAICSADGYKKLLPFVDMAQKLTVNGVPVGTISATEKRCAKSGVN